MKENTPKDRIEVLTWLGYVVASPIAVLGMTVFLLSACLPIDVCPDLQCEYGYAEQSEPDRSDAEPESEKGDDKGGKDKGDDD